jgi:hypothetical protein
MPIEGGVTGPEDLFPNGSPSAEDVHQTGLGDCYLQAVLIDIAAQDPGQLRRMMAPQGDRVTVRFHAQTTGPQPVLQGHDITVAATLPTDAAGAPLYNRGAKWARLFQKAFAVFAQTHGQYGVGFAPAERTTREGQGYAAIGSGVAYQLYQVFYGAAFRGAERVELGYDQAAAGLGVSLPTVNKLIAQSATTGPITMLSAGSSTLPLVSRARAELARVTRPQDFAVYFSNLDIYLRNAETALAAEPRRPGGARPDGDIPEVQTLRNAASDLTTNELHPQVNQTQPRRLLKDMARTAPAMKAVYDLLLDLREIGVDTSDRERFIYSGHAYAIAGAQIVVGGRRMLTALTQPDLERLDVDGSTVTLRNPHHGNVPTELESSGRPPGEFQLSLREFLRHFTQLDSGVVERRQ